MVVKTNAEGLAFSMAVNQAQGQRLKFVAVPALPSVNRSYYYPGTAGLEEGAWRQRQHLRPVVVPQESFSGHRVPTCPLEQSQQKEEGVRAPPSRHPLGGTAIATGVCLFE